VGFPRGDAGRSRGRPVGLIAVRFTGFVGVLLLVVVGVMFADLEKNPRGTTAAANGIVAIEKPGLNALLGKTS
jgi:hypothetical protein